MPAGFHIFTIVVSFFYIIIFTVGLANAIAPKWCWKIFESWKAAKEPAKAYFLIRRLSGIVVMIIIATIAFVPTLAAYFDT